VANLLANAAKYTDRGGHIVLETAREGGRARIRVSDTGIGFESTMKSRLFTLFEQEASAVNRAAGGLGIGLALVREFTERHGGTVEAESPGPGRGSTFTLRLPLTAPGH
jgi:signal transduction histidine kinase